MIRFLNWFNNLYPVWLVSLAVIAFCKAHMAHFKVPKKVILVDSLPKNPSGKLLKRELRTRFSA